MRPFKFIHMADLHLGNTQYDNSERFRDFGHAFQFILNFGKENHVDFILIAGDFFNKSDIKPEVMMQAYTILTQFKETCKNSIPIIVIEGNHDIKAYGSLRSWLQLLAELDLIILLNSTNRSLDSSSELVIEDYNPKLHKGGKIKIGDAYIYGIQYNGYSIRNNFSELKQQIHQSPEIFNILMMHFGISGLDPNKIGIEYDNTLSELKKVVDYLALGHFHNQYILNDWIYNPGSIESNNIHEYYDLIHEKRGFFLVSVNGKEPNQRKVDLKQPPNRVFITINVDITSYESWKKVVENILSKLDQSLQKRDQNNVSDKELGKPILTVYLTGILSFPRNEIKFHELIQWIQDNYNILLVRIENQTINLKEKIQSPLHQRSTIQSIERKAFEQLIKGNSLYSTSSEKIINFMLELKPKLMKTKQDPEVFIQIFTQWWNDNLSIIQEQSNKKEIQKQTDTFPSKISDNHLSNNYQNLSNYQKKTNKQKSKKKSTSD